MPEIAIVEAVDCGGCYECSGHTFAQSITRWDVVTEEELVALRKHYAKSTKRVNSSHWIIVRADTRVALDSVQKVIKDIKLEAEKEEKRKQQLAAEKLRKEKEKAKKAEEKERETFEKLRKKFEGSV